jgi:hypothetical protein
VVPPFKDGGIREWQVINDPDEGKYREGNSPLGLDFANYTIGGLVPNRRNYQFEDKEYKRVVGQITWRLRQLGYSLEAFGEIDKAIANRSYFGRAERPTIERYGKKYARIAYFEQYGLRQDEGLLDNPWHEPVDRPSEADIDPSFPDDPPKVRLIENVLGDRSTDVRAWVEHGPTPEFGQYLLQQTFDKLVGPWILLDGHCSQYDKGAERHGFVRLQSFLLLKEDLNEFIGLLRCEPPRGKWLPDASEDHYTFAGEVPWCDTFPRNELQTVDFVTGKTRVKVDPNDPRYKWRFVMKVGDSERALGPSELPEFEEVNLYRKIPVYVPIRNNSFTPSGAVQRTSCIVPTKELADLFHLWLDLPSWNLHDQSGRSCSVVATAGSLGDYEQYLFFRKELVDKLLSSQNLALVWAVWGERQHFGGRHAMTNAPSHGYRYFQQVYRYRHGRPERVTPAP